MFLTWKTVEFLSFVVIAMALVQQVNNNESQRTVLHQV